ncbi:MAG: Gfo/Idh/MocA family oxidoreductase [Abditibacteriales bacterium]|nr:Gfo/Idh/MocA family oxidoreductase [Abditibacteriales bacterium]MDW8365798.1 Gfo/Idh/MocA family oxidoreductase [Abditibacteriales bacterium]
MSVLRIAVIGAGARAQAHLTTIRKMADKFTLCAIADADGQRAREVAERYQVKGYTDALEMMDAERPEVVFIVVPPDGHHFLTEQAAMRGCHIICETPIATTLPCADYMIAAAQRYGVKLEVAENVWRFPTERLKKQIIDAGLIGKVTQVHLWYTSGSYHGMNAMRTHIGAQARRVRGFTAEFPCAPHGELINYELGLIDFENGALGVYQLPSRRERGNYWEIEGTAGQIIGSDLFLYDANGKRVRYPFEIEYEEITSPSPLLDKEGQGEVIKVLARIKVNTDPPIVWENPFKQYHTMDIDDVARADQLMSIYRAVTENIEPDYGALNARHDQEILIALRESARQNGVPIELPLTGITEHEQRIHEMYRQKYGHDPLDHAAAAARKLYPRIGVPQTIGRSPLGL